MSIISFHASEKPVIRDGEIFEKYDWVVDRLGRGVCSFCRGSKIKEALVIVLKNEYGEELKISESCAKKYGKREAEENSILKKIFNFKVLSKTSSIKKNRLTDHKIYQLLSVKAITVQEAQDYRDGINVNEILNKLANIFERTKEQKSITKRNTPSDITSYGSLQGQGRFYMSKRTSSKKIASSKKLELSENFNQSPQIIDVSQSNSSEIPIPHFPIEEEVVNDDFEQWLQQQINNPQDIADFLEKFP